jgi:hypothetical protein
MKGVNKFRIDPEHLRKMLERQTELQNAYSEFISADGMGGVLEVPGFLTMDLNNQRKKSLNSTSNNGGNVG